MVTIGVIGAGKLAPRMIRTLLDDQLEAHEDMRLLIPATKKHLTDEVDVIADWAMKNEVAYEVISDDTLDDDEDVIEDAAGVIDATKGKVPETMAAAVAEVEGRLFVLWDDNDDDGYLAFEKAHEAGVECYDMVNGLERLTFDEGDEEEPPANAPDPVEEDEPAPAKPEGEGLDTRAEMMRLTVPVLKKMMAERGITLNRSGKGRIARGAYVDAILIYDETGQKVFMQEGATAVPISEEEVAQANDADVPQEPAEDEEQPDPEVEAVAGLDDAEAVEVPAEEAEKAAPLFVPTTGSLETTTQSSNPVVGHMTITNNTPVATAAINPLPHLVSECKGCGGPIYAMASDQGEWPMVVWSHASKCPLI